MVTCTKLACRSSRHPA